MPVINMNKNIKDAFPDYIILTKIGSFVETFNNDAKILSYLSGYKISRIGDNGIKCGFPKTSISKVISILEKNKVSYIVVDRANNYYEEEKNNYKKQNKYNEIFVIAEKKYNINSSIRKIMYFLEDNPDKIKEVEKLLYE